MRRYELTDAQWELIQEHMPEKKVRGRPRAIFREVINGILWILHTGAPWRDLPEYYGPWKTVYHWFNTWCKDGTYDRILKALEINLDKKGKIDWDLWYVDGSSIRASRAAAGGGKRGAQKSLPITLLAVPAVDLGQKYIWYVIVEASHLAQ